MASFNELEEKALRWLENEYAERGRGPEMMEDECTEHGAFMAHLGITMPNYRRLLARFESLGLISYNPVLLDAEGGHLYVEPKVVEVVRELDDAAPKRVPRPDNG